MVSPRVIFTLLLFILVAFPLEAQRAVKVGANNVLVEPTPAAFRSANGIGDMLLGTSQTVTGAKAFNDSMLKLNGSTSGTITLTVPAVAGTHTIAFPAVSGDVLVLGATLVASDSTSVDLNGNLFTLTGGLVNFDNLNVIDTVTATTLIGALTGNATTATTLATGRTLALTGDVSWTSPAFNGSANVTAAATLANTAVAAGTYGSATQVGVFTVDAKGRLTAASNTTATPAESSVTFTDITTNNASTSKHGYVPKLPNDAAKFYDGTGNYSTPTGGTTISTGYVSSDWTSSSATFTDVTGLSFAVAASTNYVAHVWIGAQGTTSNGIKLKVTGPASPTAVQILIQSRGNGSPAFLDERQTAFGATPATAFLPGGGSAMTGEIRVDIVVKNGANAGTVQIQANNAAGSGTCTIYALSELEAHAF